MSCKSPRPLRVVWQQMLFHRNIKARMLKYNVPASKVKVVTENGVVFVRL